MICAGWIRLRCVGLPGLTNGSMPPWRCVGFCRGSAFRFFGRQRIGAMADRRHHGEGEHHQGNVAMPPMPRSALVVIEPELVFRGLKTVLDRPPMAFDRHQRFDGCSRWTPGGEEGEIAIGDMTTDQQTARPQTLICAVEFFDLEIGQFEITPIMQPRSFGSGPCRQAFPVGRAPRPGDVCGLAGDRSPLAPGLKHVSAADPEHIAFACVTQLLFDIANTVDGVTSNPLEWYRRGYGACDHSRRKLWFGRKAGIGGHVCGFQAIWIVAPFLRKIQRTIDERMTVARNVGSEDSDLAVRDLACGTSVLPRHSARRLALLEKAGLVDHEHRVVIRQMLDDIIAYDIAQGIRIPIHAAQDRLLTPWAGIASRLGAHPTGLALLISEKAFQEQACIRRNTLLPEQRTYPLLDLLKRRRPQRKRLLNRRCPRPRSSNHGCPWIQKPSEKATVMLGLKHARRIALNAVQGCGCDQSNPGRSSRGFCARAIPKHPLSIGVGLGPVPGSRLDADHPENGVLIPCRNTAAALVSAIQISCNARLAFGCWLFGNLAITFAVLCTQQRCSRVFGQTSPAAFQNPSAPSAMTSCGGTSSPRRFRSSSRSRQSCALSRAPSVKPTSSLRPSGVAPISTRMHCFSSSRRAWRWMPSAQM